MKIENRKSAFFYIVLFHCALLSHSNLSYAEERIFKIANDFPKIMGMNIGKKHYDDDNYQRQLSKNHIVIMGFYRGWGENRRISISDVLRKIKSYNNSIMIGQYTIINEFTTDLKDQAKRDIIDKLNKENWWLKNSKKEKLQWTKQYNAWEVNITDFAKPDSEGKKFPQWIAERNYNVFFKNNPFLDIWYIDNLFYKPRIHEADWKNENRNVPSSDEKIQKAYREGYIAYLKRAKELSPELMYIVNADSDLNNDEYKNKFHGAFLEGLMGYSWSLESWAGWERMMERYHNVFHHLIDPKIVGFHVIGDPKNKSFFRYSYSSCLLNDGYFSFSDRNNEYSSVVWFDEFNYSLGKPLEDPKREPWRGKLYRRAFERGIVYVNPGSEEDLVEIDKGYRPIEQPMSDKQKKTNGKKWYTIGPKDGAIFIKE